MTDTPDPAPVQTVATTDLDAYATLVSAEPAPGPGSRVARTIAQGGGVVVWIDLWHSFGWLGAADWNAEQAAQRWPAITAAGIALVSIVHNITNWWLARSRLARLG